MKVQNSEIAHAVMHLLRGRRRMGYGEPNLSVWICLTVPSKYSGKNVASDRHRRGNHRTPSFTIRVSANLPFCVSILSEHVISPDIKVPTSFGDLNIPALAGH